VKSQARRYGRDGLKVLLSATETHWKESVDGPDCPPEPVTQVRVLPGGAQFRYHGTICMTERPEMSWLVSLIACCPRCHDRVVTAGVSFFARGHTRARRLARYRLQVDLRVTDGHRQRHFVPVAISQVLNKR